ncbi:MAG: hypothetical protein WKG01_29210 [Kofleriaceae bacterium]
MIDPNEWQRWIVRLLRQRYSFIDLVEVPDNAGGDRGLEAFTRDGCCYQCYAQEGEPSVGERYERNRNKMTADLRKFVANAEDLQALFGEMVIRRWVFMIPVHDNRKLVEHGAKKCAEIREKGLPYVAADFEIQIATDDYFELERNLLLSEGLAKLDLPRIDVAGDAIVAFASANSAQIGKLDTKIGKIIRANRDELKEQLLKKYLQGEDTLARLRSYPELYEAFVALRSNRAEYVAIKSLTRNAASAETLTDTIEEFRSEIKESIKGFDPPLAELLATAATVSWLLECQLNFPDVES